MKYRGVCFETEIASMPIRLIQKGKDNFTVVYWKQVKRGLNYADAAFELGACIMHACSLADKLDNREKNEI